MARPLKNQIPENITQKEAYYLGRTRGYSAGYVAGRRAGRNGNGHTEVRYIPREGVLRRLGNYLVKNYK